ncbi:MAG: TIR domain-containing protein [Allosphingosinicella sp.]
MTAVDTPKGTNGEPTTVFVSYSRADRKRVLPIIEALEQAGYSVWWDGLLEGGERFSHTTQAAIENAKAVVVVWSKTSQESHWVHDEATRGRDRRCLVPLSLDGTEPPLGFGQFQTIDVSRSGRRAGASGFEPVVRAVAALHDLPPAPAPAGGRRTVTAQPITRRHLLGGAAVLAGAPAAAGAAWWTGLIGPTEASARSVAVLPFDNLSGDPDKVYFSDGLAAEVRAQLARNPLLQVAAQASSNRFRETDDDAKAITRALGVGYLLDGNVRPSGDMVRVSTELIDGRTGYSQWSQTFDRPMADVFAVQEEIARAVTSALTEEVASREADEATSDRRATGGTSSLAAYDAYLRGKDLFDRAVDEESDRAALASFERAILADPQYGLAHAARSRTLAVIGNQYDQGATRRATYDEAVEAANRGVRLAPDLAEVHSALGFALFNGRIDARAARAPYERSFSLGRGDADVLSRYALFSARCGRFDAARETIARAAALDPLNARTLRQIGDVEYSARRYAQSIPPIRRALALNPQLSVAHSAIGASQLMMGKIDDARAEYELEPNTLFKLTGLAIIAHRQGRQAQAMQALEQLRAEHGDNSLYQQAQVQAQWGQLAQAGALLNRALEEIDAGLVYLRNDPFIDPLRGEPAFNYLLNRLGFA